MGTQGHFLGFVHEVIECRPDSKAVAAHSFFGCMPEKAAWNLKSWRFGRSFSFSFWGDLQVPAISSQGE